MDDVLSPPKAKLKNPLYFSIQKQAQLKKKYLNLNDLAYSYKNLLTTIHKMNGLFIDRGVALEDKIIIISKHDNHILDLFISALCLGICPVIISAQSKKNKIISIISEVKPALVFSDSEFQLAIEKNKNMVNQK